MEWKEFLQRFLIYHEEFLFIYKGSRIEISFVPNYSIALSYGNQEHGFLWKDYVSPNDFLKDRLFDGKTLEEIWSELD